MKTFKPEYAHMLSALHNLTAGVFKDADSGLFRAEIASFLRVYVSFLRIQPHTLRTRW